MDNAQENAKLEQHGNIRPADVLLGRGKQVLHHPGNIAYRRDVQARLEDHKDRGSSDRDTIARDVLHQVHRRGGRFLCPRGRGTSSRIITTPDSTQWELFPDGMAVEKIKQALRDAGRKRQRRQKKQSNNSLENESAILSHHPGINIFRREPSADIPSIGHSSCQHFGIDLDSWRAATCGSSPPAGAIPIGWSHQLSNASTPGHQTDGFLPLQGPEWPHFLFHNAPRLDTGSLNQADGWLPLQPKDMSPFGLSMELPTQNRSTIPSQALPATDDASLMFVPRFALDSDMIEILRRLREGHAAETDAQPESDEARREPNNSPSATHTL